MLILSAKSPPRPHRSASRHETSGVLPQAHPVSQDEDLVLLLIAGNYFYHQPGLR